MTRVNNNCRIAEYGERERGGGNHMTVVELSTLPFIDHWSLKLLPRNNCLLEYNTDPFHHQCSLQSGGQWGSRLKRAQCQGSPAPAPDQPIESALQLKMNPLRLCGVISSFAPPLSAACCPVLYRLHTDTDMVIWPLLRGQLCVIWSFQVAMARLLSRVPNEVIASRLRSFAWKSRSTEKRLSATFLIWK